MFDVVEGRQRPKKALVHEESISGATSINKHSMSLGKTSSAVGTNPNIPKLWPREEALDYFQRYKASRNHSSDSNSTTLHQRSKKARSKRNRIPVQYSKEDRGRMSPHYESALQVSRFPANMPTPLSAFTPNKPFQDPQPRIADISCMYLQYYCHRYFGTRAMAHSWLLQMKQSPDSFLSILAIAASHEDAISGELEPTRRTVKIQTEISNLLNEAFDERGTRIKDTTIMSVVRLLRSELINTGTERLVFYEKGLRQLIEERGGLRRLGVQGELSALAAVSIPPLHFNC